VRGSEEGVVMVAVKVVVVVGRGGISARPVSASPALQDRYATPVPAAVVGDCWTAQPP
jgi:hypothetical protein